MLQASGDGTPPFLAVLGESAKQHAKRKYHRPSETMSQMDVLRQAWTGAAANGGVPGIDGVGFQSTEEGREGVEGHLQQLQSDLETGRYQPQPVRRVLIRKAGDPGKQRPLGVSTVRDRVAMTAAKLVLDEQGWNPRMGKPVRKWLTAGRVSHGKREATESGAPQGGAIWRLLANLYMHCFDRRWRREGWDQGQLVRYAHAFVILWPSAEQAAQVVDTARQILTPPGLRLNTEETGAVNLRDRTQGFYLLGFTHRMNPDRRSLGRRHMFRWPSAKAAGRIFVKMQDLLLGPYLPGNVADVVAELNSLPRGWGAYFRRGESARVFLEVDNYVRHRFALHLARTCGRKGTGWKWQRSDRTWTNLARLLKALGIHWLDGTRRTIWPAARA